VGLDTCPSGWPRFDTPASSQFLGALSHRGQSHPTAIGRRQALPIINDFKVTYPLLRVEKKGGNKRAEELPSGRVVENEHIYDKE